MAPTANKATRERGTPNHPMDGLAGDADTQQHPAVKPTNYRLANADSMHAFMSCNIESLSIGPQII